MNHHQLLLDVLKSSVPSWNNFIVSLSNSQAINAVKNIKSGQALYLWGNSGCGRTHILHAMTNNSQSIYFNSSFLTRKIYNLINLREKKKIPKLIAFDDVHLFSNDQQAILFALYNFWKELNSTSYAFSLIMTGKFSAKKLLIREDLRTRLESNLIFYLTPLTDNEKLVALTRKAHDKQIKVGSKVIQWMLTHHERDIRNLSTLLDAIDHYSLLTKRRITIPLLRTMLQKANLYEK